MIGSLTIQLDQIKGSISMIGKVNICDYISIGYD